MSIASISLMLTTIITRIGWYKDGIELDNTINNYIHVSRTGKDARKAT